MKSGRVPRSVRQWMNFLFLMLLLSGVGYFTWQSSYERVFVVPENHVVLQLHKPYFQLPWSKSEVKVLEAGSHRLTRKDQDSPLNCYPLGELQFEYQGVLDTTTTTGKLASFVGLASKKFVEVRGSLTLQTDKAAFTALAQNSNGVENFNKLLESPVANALVQHIGKADNTETLSVNAQNELNESLSTQLSVKVAQFQVESLTASELSTPTQHLEVTQLPNQVALAEIKAEMPREAYIGIALALVCTLFLYGVIRVLFGELLALLLYFPLHAIGFNPFEVHAPGYYQTRRRNDRRGKSSYGVSDAAADVVGGLGELAGSAIDYGHAAHAAHGLPSIGDAVDVAEGVGSAIETVSNVGEALGGLGDMAEGIGDAAGSIFDALGALGDIF